MEPCPPVSDCWKGEIAMTGKSECSHIRETKAKPVGVPTYDEKSVKAVADIKVASVMRRDRSMLCVLCGLLCIAYVTLYRQTSAITWVILAIATGVAMVWFGMTAMAARKSVKKAVLSIDQSTEDGVGATTAGRGGS